MGNQVIFAIKKSSISSLEKMSNKDFSNLICSRMNRNFTHYEKGVFVSHAHHSTSSCLHIIGGSGGYNINRLFIKPLDFSMNLHKNKLSDSDILDVLKPIVREDMNVSVLTCGEANELTSNSDEDDSYFVFGFLTDCWPDINDSNSWKNSVLAICKGENINLKSIYGTVLIGEFPADQYVPVYIYQGLFQAFLPFNCDSDLVAAATLKNAKERNNDSTSFEAIQKMFDFYGFVMNWKV